MKKLLTKFIMALTFALLLVPTTAVLASVSEADPRLTVTYEQFEAMAQVYDQPNGDGVSAYGLYWKDSANGIAAFRTQYADTYLEWSEGMDSPRAMHVILYRNGVRLPMASGAVNSGTGSDKTEFTADLSKYMTLSGDYQFYVTLIYYPDWSNNSELTIDTDDRRYKIPSDNAQGFIWETDDWRIRHAVAKSPVYTVTGRETFVPLASPPTFGSDHFSHVYADNNNNFMFYERLSNTNEYEAMLTDVIAVNRDIEQQMQFMKTDGSLWVMGRNDMGQLGQGTVSDHYANFDEAVKVMDNAAYFTQRIKSMFAIQTDGSLWAWGRNENYQLGDGTREDRYTPVKIMDGAAFVTSTGFETYVIKQDGTLWGFGTYEKGKRVTTSFINDGTRPELLMENVISVAAGTGTSGTYVVKDDYSVWHLFEGKVPEKIADGVQHVVLGGAIGVIKTDGSLWTSVAEVGYGEPMAFEYGNNGGKLYKTMDGVVALMGDGNNLYATAADGNVWRIGEEFTGSDVRENRIAAENIKLPITGFAPVAGY